jgi:mRNA-degrading endonuclease RelE of RelBE toxin-antitoxin system
MKWRLVITPPVQKSLRVFPPRTKQYIRHALDEIRKNPMMGKPLKDDLSGFYSFRARRFRVVYQIRRKIITVVVIGIGPRKTIYQDLITQIRRR